MASWANLSAEEKALHWKRQAEEARAKLGTHRAALSELFKTYHMGEGGAYGFQPGVSLGPNQILKKYEIDRDELLKTTEPRCIKCDSKDLSTEVTMPKQIGYPFFSGGVFLRCNSCGFDMSTKLDWPNGEKGL